MKIGGYSHLSGITFFSDLFKIKGSVKGGNVNYNMEWITPPKWLRKLENKFLLGGLLVLYYQWKVLDKKIKGLFFFLLGFYILDELVDLSTVDKYFDYYIEKFGIYVIIVTLLILVLNYKKISRLFRFHGAEHKAINCYVEHGYVDTYLIRKASRFNKRCGSNIASVFLLLYIPLWFLKIESIAIIAVAFLIAVQITRTLAMKDYKWDKYIQVLQWITALEPTEKEMEVAVGAFNNLQRAYFIYKTEKAKNIKIV